MERFALVVLFAPHRQTVKRSVSPARQDQCLWRFVAEAQRLALSGWIVLHEVGVVFSVCRFAHFADGFADVDGSLHQSSLLAGFGLREV